MEAPVVQPELNADGNYNILFISTDQEHHFEEFPEGTEYKARELLRELGVTFEKHYNCSNMSTSSRSVMYTGTHITNTHMLDNTDFEWQDALSTDIATIGDMMRDAGYYSAYKGKWHMGNSSILYDTGDELTSLEGYGFSDWGADGDYIGESWEGYEKDPDIVQDASEWLTEKGAAVNKEGGSFFLAVNLINPHDVMNYTPNGYKSQKLDLRSEPDDEIYKKQYGDDLSSSWQQDLSKNGVVEAVRSYRDRWFAQTGEISTEEDWQAYQDYYYNCIQDSDNSLADILRTVFDLGMLDNTIIVLTADHGEMQGSHGLKGKGGFIYENNVHVPLTIYCPGAEGGKSVTAVTSHLDLAPTLVDLTNISEEKKAAITKDLPGHSLVGLMKGEDTSVREGALFCYEMLSFAAKGVTGADGKTSYDISGRNFVRAVFTERYKFARYFAMREFNTSQTLEELLANNDVELYDLENDPEEMNNLAADPEANSELIMQMNGLMNSLIKQEIGTDDGQECRDNLNAYLEKAKGLTK